MPATEDHCRPEGDEHDGVADTQEPEGGRGHDAREDGLEEVAPEVVRRRPPPRDERAHPMRKSRPRKSGMFTWLKNGAPTLTLTPRTASERSGNTVPKKTVKAAAIRRRLLSRKADSRETIGVELALAAQVVPCARRGGQNDPTRTRARKVEEEHADRALGEGVHGADDAGAGEEGAEEREAEGEDHEGTRFHSFSMSPPLLDHHRVQERGAGEPRHEAPTFSTGIPRPVAAPAEHVVAPPAADEQAQARGSTRRSIVQRRVMRDPHVAGAPGDERGHGEGEGHGEAGEAQIEGDRDA